METSAPNGEEVKTKGETSKPDRVLTGARTFDDELEAQTYIQRMQQQEHQNITLF